MTECELCSGTGLVTVKSRDQVCKSCAGIGKITQEPVEQPETSEAEPEKEVIPEPKKEKFLKKIKNSFSK